MRILFLDDDEKRQKRFRSEVPFCQQVRTAEEAIDALFVESYDLICLDHDLGGEVFVDPNRLDTGSEVVRRLVSDLLERQNKAEIVVHSYNEDASADMVMLLRNYGFRANYCPFGSGSFWERVSSP